MCTVSFIPLNGNDYVLTSNRDESLSRGQAGIPQKVEHSTTKVFAPVDSLAKGSWIAAAPQNRWACLLNGAFTRHKRKLPYRISRGKVVFDSFLFSSAARFRYEYDFDNVEPFTLIQYHNGLLSEMRWDAQKIHYTEPDPRQIHVWSSATLYEGNLPALREEEFKSELLTLHNLNTESIQLIHREKFLYELWIEKQNRAGDVQTLSITSIEQLSNRMRMRHHDLLSGLQSIISVSEQ